MEKPVFIIVNPYCHQGRGWKRWLSIKTDVLQEIPGARVIVSEKGMDLDIEINRVLQSNEDACLISAGGDGSIHALVNILLDTANGEGKLTPLGAIGLGSSNDFLKPFHRVIKNVPVRINTRRPYLFQDVGRVKYVDPNNIVKEKFFIVNASFGATAEGNWNFNNPGPLLQWLKKNTTGIAITYTAITTILSYKNKSAIIRFNGEEKQSQVSNINILKIPYVSGTLHYSQAVLPDDGRLGLNICSGMNKRELLSTLFNLEKGRFSQNHKRISTFVDHFQLRSDSPVVFECDGETEKSTYVDISLLPRAVQLFGN
jgi:diacylglycerol kinase family enzyme